MNDFLSRISKKRTTEECNRVEEFSLEIGFYFDHHTDYRITSHGQRIEGRTAKVCFSILSRNYSTENQNWYDIWELLNSKSFSSRKRLVQHGVEKECWLEKLMFKNIERSSIFMKSTRVINKRRLHLFRWLTSMLTLWWYLDKFLDNSGGLTNMIDLCTAMICLILIIWLTQGSEKWTLTIKRSNNIVIM